MEEVTEVSVNQITYCCLEKLVTKKHGNRCSLNTFCSVLITNNSVKIPINLTLENDAFLAPTFEVNNLLPLKDFL